MADRGQGAKMNDKQGGIRAEQNPSADFEISILWWYFLYLVRDLFQDSLDQVGRMLAPALASDSTLHFFTNAKANSVICWHYVSQAKCVYLLERAKTIIGNNLTHCNHFSNCLVVKLVVKRSDPAAGLPLKRTFSPNTGLVFYTYYYWFFSISRLKCRSNSKYSILSFFYCGWIDIH